MYNNSHKPSLALLKGDESKTPEGTRRREDPLQSVCFCFFYCCYDKHNKSHLRGQGLFWLIIPAYGMSWWGSHSSRTGSSWPRGIHSRNSVTDGCFSSMDVSLQFPLSIYTGRDPSQRIMPPTVGGLPTLIIVIRTVLSPGPSRDPSPS